jgi:acyl carrier protein
MKHVSAYEVQIFILQQLEEPLAEAGWAADAVSDDFDLHGHGIIDSFGLIELISAIEQRFDLEVDFEDLDPEGLTVLGPLSRFIEAQSAVASTT